MNEPKETTVLSAGKFLRFVKRGNWEFVERVGISGIVAVAATDEDGRLILVSQWREPVNHVVLELPAGLVGDADAPDEPAEEAAKRELYEETGYTGGIWREATPGPPSAGASSEIVRFFLARGVRKLGAGGGVAGERISVHAVDPGRLLDFCRAAATGGWLTDPKVYAGAWLLKEAGR